MMDRFRSSRNDPDEDRYGRKLRVSSAMVDPWGIPSSLKGWRAAGVVPGEAGAGECGQRVGAMQGASDHRAAPTRTSIICGGNEIMLKAMKWSKRECWFCRGQG